MKKIRGFSGSVWPQYQEEIQPFIGLLKGHNVKSYLEIGCRHGDTFHAVGLALPKGSLLVAVDLPGARSGKHTSGNRRSERALHRAASDLKRRGQRVMVVIGDSHSAEVIKKVNKYAPFDAVFIDGDHSPDGVRADWRNYGPMTGLVAFHDIQTKVSSLYNELKAQYKHMEFAFYDKGGIGIIWNQS